MDEKQKLSETENADENLLLTSSQNSGDQDANQTDIKIKVEKVEQLNAAATQIPVTTVNTDTDIIVNEVDIKEEVIVDDCNNVNSIISNNNNQAPPPLPTPAPPPPPPPTTVQQQAKPQQQQQHQNAANILPASINQSPLTIPVTFGVTGTNTLLNKSTVNNPSAINITISNGEIRSVVGAHPTSTSNCTTIGRAIAPKPITLATLSTKLESLSTNNLQSENRATTANAPTTLLIASSTGQQSQIITSSGIGQTSGTSTVKLQNKTIPMALVPTSDGCQMIAVPLSVLNASRKVFIPVQSGAGVTSTVSLNKGKTTTLTTTPVKAKMIINPKLTTNTGATITGLPQPITNVTSTSTIGANISLMTTGVTCGQLHTNFSTILTSSNVEETALNNNISKNSIISSSLSSTQTTSTYIGSISSIANTNLTTNNKESNNTLASPINNLIDNTANSLPNTVNSEKQTNLSPDGIPIDPVAAIPVNSTESSSLADNEEQEENHYDLKAPPMLTMASMTPVNPDNITNTSLSIDPPALTQILLPNLTPMNIKSEPNTDLINSSSVSLLPGKVTVTISSGQTENSNEITTSASTMAKNNSSVALKADTPQSINNNAKSDLVASTDFDPINIMDWKDGIGTLPGSNLKFKINEFGTLEMVDDKEADEIINKNKASANKSQNGDERNRRSVTITTNQTSNKNSIQSSNSIMSTSGTTTPTIQIFDPQEQRICVNCGVKGTRSNFIRQGKFCSQDCATIQSTHLRQFAKKGAHLPTTVSNSVLRDNKKRLIKPKIDAKSVKTRKLANVEKEISEHSPNPETEEMMNAIESYDTSLLDVDDIDTDTPEEDKKFNWKRYLIQMKCVPVPLDFFNDYQNYPKNKNHFKVGMKLEGVDPAHPSMFCVLTVAEVLGYRVRLHFDGYRDMHDFWLNCDSPFLFPVGWCEKTGRKLQPPKSITEFNWSTYLQQHHATPAPKNIFSCSNSVNINKSIAYSHGFRIGAKLEAVDKANSSLVCVSTINDIIDNWLLIHFDGWDDSYDYWTDISSTYIHPVNWCRSKGRSLTPPKDYHKSSEKFSWDEYLSECKATAVPAKAFKMRLSNNLKVGMKLEVVDKRNPKYLRVATVAIRNSHSIKIHFDGWDERYDYWVDDDSPDLHPVNWCCYTSYPILPPPSLPYDTNDNLLSELNNSNCPVANCSGLGHIRGPKYLKHHSIASCPYSEVNFDYEVSDRLGKTGIDCVDIIADDNLLSTNSYQNLSNPPTPNSDTNSFDLSTTIKNKRLQKCNESRAIKRRKLTNGTIDNEISQQSQQLQLPGSPSSNSESNKISRPSTPSSISNLSPLHQTIFALRFHQQNSSSEVPPLAWEKHSRNLLPALEKIKPSEVLNWNPKQVSTFVSSIPGCSEFSQPFLDELVDGEAFLLLNQPDLIKILGIKLGPAVKIYNSILVIRDNLSIEDA